MHLEILGKLSRIRKNQQGLTGRDFLTFYNTLRNLFKMTILLTLIRECFGQRFPMKKSLGGPLETPLTEQVSEQKLDANFVIVTRVTFSGNKFLIWPCITLVAPPFHNVLRISNKRRLAKCTCVSCVATFIGPLGKIFFLVLIHVTPIKSSYLFVLSVFLSWVSLVY